MDTDNRYSDHRNGSILSLHDDDSPSRMERGRLPLLVRYIHKHDSPSLMERGLGVRLNRVRRDLCVWMTLCFGEFRIDDIFVI